MKTIHHHLLATLGIAGALLLPGMALAGNDIVTQTPPPPLRVEHQPPHRDGYAWAPGHWEWNGSFYQWVSGTWISERPGHWVADHWDDIGTRWRYVPGHWER
jgi:WXXGXW repeat (2 copies)